MPPVKNVSGATAQSPEPSVTSDAVTTADAAAERRSAETMFAAVPVGVPDSSPPSVIMICAPADARLTEIEIGVGTPVGVGGATITTLIALPDAPPRTAVNVSPSLPE